jgi:hypothetical protein
MMQVLENLCDKDNKMKSERLWNREAESYIKKDDVPVSVSIMTVNTIKPLRELDIAHFLPHQRIHHETHSLFYGLAIVDVVITVQVQ